MGTGWPCGHGWGQAPALHFSLWALFLVSRLPFFRAAMVRGLPTHDGSLKPALRWTWPRRDGDGLAVRPRLGTSPSPTFFSVGVVPGFPIAVFPRGYGSWITHPRRLSKAGPTVELASAGRRTMRLGPAAWEGPAAGPSATWLSFDSRRLSLGRWWLVSRARTGI